MLLEAAFLTIVFRRRALANIKNAVVYSASRFQPFVYYFQVKVGKVWGIEFSDLPR